MSEGGLVSRILPTMLVLAFLVTGVIFALGDYSDRFGFEVDDTVSASYNYTTSITEDVAILSNDTSQDTAFTNNLEGGFFFISLPLRALRLVITSFGSIDNAIGGSISNLGLPEGYDVIIKSIVYTMAIAALIFAFASAFLRGAL